MQTTSLQSLHLFSGNFTYPKEPSSGRRKRSSSISVRAVKNDANSDHKLVDENMVVLKMRIEEVRIMDDHQENRRTPNEHCNWLDKWENEYLNKNYDSDVFEAIGFLQNLLMSTRPSLVVGVVALLMFSASTSVAVVLTYLLGIFM